MWFRGVAASVGLCFDFGAVLEGHPDVVLSVNGDVVHLRPNTEVKLSGAENSALATRCENREMPILAASFPLSNEADFYSRLFLFCELLISNPPLICQPPY
jgi:hypothetical protein